MLDEKTYTRKRYIHFDKSISIRKIESYVCNPMKIAKHSFLPFIHYVISFEKRIDIDLISEKKRPVKKKDREIMYAGHRDNYIYKYYANILNEEYNNVCKELALDDCITAYRNNKDKKSNVDYAAEVIDKIIHFQDAYIIVGDFTKFFDSLDHEILKEQLKIILGVQWLSKDWFNVLRSITKFGFYEKALLEKEIGTDKYLRSINKRAYFQNLKEFRRFQKKNKTNYNTKKYGIPQGTAISAVLSNVYALSFDKEVKKIADDNDGIYRRYSDDFILVLPKKRVVNENQLNVLIDQIEQQAKDNKIELQTDKTRVFDFEKGTLKSLDSEKTNTLNYLGFIFDGETVKMRGKSTYKFYRKAYKLIRKANWVKEKKQLSKIPYRKRIYKLYTDLGNNNLISYAERAQHTFDLISPNSQNLIIKQLKNRKRKIEKKINMKIHT